MYGNGCTDVVGTAGFPRVSNGLAIGPETRYRSCGPSVGLCVVANDRIICKQKLLMRSRYRLSAVYKSLGIVLDGGPHLPCMGEGFAGFRPMD